MLARLGTERSGKIRKRLLLVTRLRRRWRCAELHPIHWSRCLRCLAGALKTSKASRLRQAQTRWQSSSPARQQQIEALSRQLAELELRAETVQKSESRLERLIAEQMVRWIRTGSA